MKDFLYNFYKKIVIRFKSVYLFFYSLICKKRLKNHDFSIICDSCIGGLIYNRLGLKFLSPTINLWIGNSSDEFIDMVENLKEYMNTDLLFTHELDKYPRALIKKTRIGFSHYKTDEEAGNKWNERKNRINYNNIYVIMRRTNGLNINQYGRLTDLKNNKLIKNFIVLGSEDCKGICDVKIKGWTDNNDMFHILNSGKRMYEKSFDFIKFLNS